LTHPTLTDYNHSFVAEIECSITRLGPMVDMFSVPYITYHPPAGELEKFVISDLNVPLYRNIYTAASESVVVPSNGFVLDIVISLGRQLRRTRVSAAKAPRGASIVSVKGEIRRGLTRSYTARSRGKTLSRDEMILGGNEQMGTIVERLVPDMLVAVDSLLEQMDELWGGYCVRIWHLH
jgi:hypothetical protein